MSSDDVVIRASGLTKTYRIYERPQDRLWQALWRGRRTWYTEFRALNGVDLEVRRGETLAIIGVNGSGKSTLLQILCGTLAPTEGSFDVRGRVAALLELGAGFNPEFSGRENVYLNGALLGLTNEEIDDRYASIARFADIGSFIEEPVKTYSSGMYVRLAFAVAVNSHPDVLVVDEALAVGDVFFQQKCNLHMQRELADVTKLLVTHDLGSVAKLADRALVLGRGDALFHGEPLEAIEFYTRLARGNVEGRDQRRTPPGGDRTPAPAGEEDPPVALQQVPLGDDESGVEVVPAGWTAVPSDKLSGDLAATILAVKLEGAREAGLVQPGDELRLRLRCTAGAPLDEVIVGYVVMDRYGTSVCGDNSLSLQPRLQLLAGETEFSLSFTWPDIADADYFLTPGIGYGDHELVHTIACWAHSAVKVTSVTYGRPVHGLFTNPLAALEQAHVSGSVAVSAAQV